MNSQQKNDITDSTDWPDVSVIIVNCNARIWLEKFFKSVLDSDYPKDKLKIILIDNASTDGGVKFVAEAFRSDPRITVIQNEKNMGWAFAVNQGIKKADGRIIAHISSDVEVHPGWLKEIVKAMRADSKVGIVQCKSISIWDRKSLDSSMNFLDRYGFSYNYAPEELPREVFFAEGLAFAVRREVIEDIGMLDDYYFMQFDDQDFSWRARLAGYKVLFVPSAVVYHVRGGTVGRTYFDIPLPILALYVRNHLLTLIKNYELKNLLKALPVELSTELGRVLYLIGKKRSRFAYATLRGLFLVLKDMRLTLAKRAHVQAKVRKVSDKEIMKKMVPYNPKFLMAYLNSQATGKRLILKSRPPVE